MRFFLIGAAGGIGSSLARRLKAGGHEVILSGHTGPSLAALGSELGAAHIVVDVTNFEALEHAIQQFAPLQGM